MSNIANRVKISANQKLATGKLSRREFLATGSVLGISLAVPDVSAQTTKNKSKNMAGTSSETETDFLSEYSTTLLESAIALLRGGSHLGTELTRPPGLVRRDSGTNRLVGYAVTSTFSVDFEDERPKRENADYWKYVFDQKKPKIAVSVDASRQPFAGSSWGQLNAHIHTGLGCRGVLTNGGVRDLREFEKLNFAVFSGGLVVEHGNPHFLSFGEPVKLYNATFKPNDIVVADEQGAIVVPLEMLPDIAEACAETMRRVRSVADYCQSPNFNLPGLIEATQKMKPAAPWKPRGRRI